MKIALVGATGNVGTRLISELTRRGHHVTAIARHPEKLQGQASVSPVSGDVQNENALLISPVPRIRPVFRVILYRIDVVAVGVAPCVEGFEVLHSADTHVDILLKSSVMKNYCVCAGSRVFDGFCRSQL
jgi:hypothetical protein